MYHNLDYYILKVYLLNIGNKINDEGIIELGKNLEYIPNLVFLDITCKF